MDSKGQGRGRSGRRRRRDGTGNDDEEDGEGDAEDEELFLKEQQDKLNEEKRDIMHRKNLNGKEKNVDLSLSSSL